MAKLLGRIAQGVCWTRPGPNPAGVTAGPLAETVWVVAGRTGVLATGTAAVVAAVVAAAAAGANSPVPVYQL